MDIALMVLWNGEVLLDVGKLDSNYMLLHEANFVVCRHDDGKLFVWKERYEPDLRDEQLTYQEMFDHAARHTGACKKAGTFGASRR